MAVAEPQVDLSISTHACQTQHSIIFGVSSIAYVLPTNISLRAIVHLSSDR